MIMEIVETSKTHMLIFSKRKDDISSLGDISTTIEKIKQTQEQSKPAQTGCNFLLAMRTIAMQILDVKYIVLPRKMNIVQNVQCILYGLYIKRTLCPSSHAP